MSTEETAQEPTTDVAPAKRPSARYSLDNLGLDDIFNHSPSWFGRWWPTNPFRLFDDLEPMIKVEEYSEDNTYVLRADVAGADPEKDIDITLHENQLRIIVQRETTASDGSDGYRSEFRYGTFSRTITLPSDVKPDDVEATYKDGVLEIRLPIEAAERTKIPVTQL